MILIFGSRFEQTNEVILKEKKLCLHCMVEGNFILSSFRKYHHFFLVPVYTSARFYYLQCMHCKKVYESDSVNIITSRKPTPEINLPFWKSPLGITTKIMAFVAVFFLGGGFLFKKYGKKNIESPQIENTQTDIREEYLKQDLQKMDSSDYKENSKIAEALKLYISKTLTGIETSKIKYFTRINGDKILVLVKVSDMKKIETSSRKTLLFEIENGLNDYLELNSLKQYIGVDGNWNMLLVKTPQKSDLDGLIADEKPLFDFYDEPSKK